MLQFIAFSPRHYYSLNSRCKHWSVESNVSLSTWLYLNARATLRLGIRGWLQDTLLVRQTGFIQFSSEVDVDHVGRRRRLFAVGNFGNELQRVVVDLLVERRMDTSIVVVQNGCREVPFKTEMWITREMCYVWRNFSSSRFQKYFSSGQSLF